MRIHFFTLLFISCFIGCQSTVELILPAKVTGISDPVGSRTVTIEKAVSETVGTCIFSITPDPSLNDRFEYKVTFDSPIDPTTFTPSDISNSGTGGSTLLTWTVENCGDDTNFKLTAASIYGDGTIIPSLPAGRVQNTIGEQNQLSTSVDNSVEFSKNWYQEAYIKAANNDSSDGFGGALSLNGDSLVVGAINESSNQTTITNGATASADNTLSSSGAAYIYKRTGSTWEQEAYIKAANAGSNDYFGTAVSIHKDTIAIGANAEDSNQTTITNGTTASADNSLSFSGAVYIYKRTGLTWQQEAYIKAANARATDRFGSAVSLNSDTLAVGVRLEDSNQTTITNGTTASTNTSSTNSGAVYVYKRTGVTWQQEAYIKAANAESDDYFGEVVSLDNDTLVVGAPYEDSNQTSITNGATASADNSNEDSGAVYVYKRTGTTWVQEAYIKAVNSEAWDNFGYTLSLSGDSLAVGVQYESSNQTSITNGSTANADNSLLYSGASYIYKRTGTTWAQEAYIKAVNADADDTFGSTVSLNGDTLAVSATDESSNQSTITNGSIASTDNSLSVSGAVYIYKRTGAIWEQESYIKASNADSYDRFGAVLSLDGDTLAVGIRFEDSNQTTITNGPSASSDNSSSNSGAAYIYRNKSRLFEIHDLTGTVTSNSITVNWTKTGGSSTGYIVTYQAGATAPANCASGTDVDVGDVDTHTESALSPSTTYSFRVCATDGTSSTSGDTLTLTTLP